MRIYYQDADITVAASGVEVGGRRYPLAEIEGAWRQARRAVGRRVLTSLAVLLVVLAAEVLIVLLTRWVWAGRTLAVVAAALLVRVVAQLMAGTSALQAVEDIRRYGRSRELWVSVAHAPVLLICTDDAIRYGQVCRALTRALDDRDDRG
ncbi:DUF6232 family protein [Actinoplanes siamensis]|uniref:Uncharacterized protein n=1 Tax=Actinoplanes siamensis TaxID=1223317 RepID=A0A919KC47_9ACTN|nr:DUF6232 family protein [Actinoplanes siamensis]GIF02649.1 hypothetical protein Asi03nite_01870 [Actinoplanes siamensis]